MQARGAIKYLQSNQRDGQTFARTSDVMHIINPNHYYNEQVITRHTRHTQRLTSASSRSSGSVLSRNSAFFTYHKPDLASCTSQRVFPTVQALSPSPPGSTAVCRVICNCHLSAILLPSLFHLPPSAPRLFSVRPPISPFSCIRTPKWLPRNPAWRSESDFDSGL